MTFFRFIYFILFIYFLHIIVKKFLKLFYKKEYINPKNSTKNLEEKELVQDPQCGIFVVKDVAFKLKKGNTILYFCSKECMDKYKKIY